MTVISQMTIRWTKCSRSDSNMFNSAHVEILTELTKHKSTFVRNPNMIGKFCYLPRVQTAQALMAS